MTYSKHITREISTPNKSSRNGLAVAYIVLHHMASTNLEGTLKMWSTPTRAGSCHYAIGNEGQRIGVVPEEYRAWSLGSTTDGGKGANFDRKAIVFEIENSGLNGSWPVSDAAHESAAVMVADIATRHGIPINRDRVLGHREVYTRHKAGYATACPGGLDMDRIVRRALEIQGGAPAAAPAAPAPGGPLLLHGVNWETLQIATDGDKGRQTVRKLQWYLGFRDEAHLDGAEGPQTIKRLQEHLNARPKGANALKIHGVNWETLQIATDGKKGRQTVRKLQWALGFRTAAYLDGSEGPQTITRLQKALNAKTL